MDLTVTVGRPFRRVSSSSKNEYVAEGGGHQEESRLRQGEKGHLPGDPSIPVRVPVELVHHHVVHRRVLAVAKRDVGEDLGGAAEDRALRG